MGHFGDWRNRHKFLSNVLNVVIAMGVFYGGQFAFAHWLVSQAHPDTPTAHIYCAMVAANPDGSVNAEATRKEFVLAKQLAYQQGGVAGVAKSKAVVDAVMAEYMDHIGKGDIGELREHYRNKCLGF